MRPSILLALVFVTLAGVGRAANPLLKGDTLREVTEMSLSDGIPSGWCGRAMLSILRETGLGAGLKPGNGQDWEKILADAGWKPVAVTSPYRAPLGSVLVYTSDRRVGKAPRGTPGGYYGHVEIVALAPSGGRMYVADMPRAKPGGSVPDNFTGRAWVPPGTLVAKAAAVPVSAQIETLMSERLRMARDHFDRLAGERVSLNTDETVRFR